MLPFLIPLLCLPLYLAPLWDSDFWWHLAMGRAIVESGGVPDADSLGVYSFVTGDLRASTLQKGYWLSQLVFHALFSLAGIDGIIWLRAATIAATVGLVIWRTKDSGIGAIGLLFIGVAVGATLANFTADRPATQSYLWFAAFMALLPVDPIRLTARRSLGIGLALILWANMHGSVALAAFLLVLLAAWTTGLKILGPKTSRPARPLMQIGLLVCLALVSVLTPNGFDLYRGMIVFEGSELQARTSEYLTPWAITTQLNIPLTGYWLLLLLAPVAGYGLISRRRFDALLLLSAVLVISLSAYRYVPYFLIGGAPFLASGLTAVRSSLNNRLGRIASLGALAATGAMVSLALPQYADAKFGINEARFPINAASFVRSRSSNASETIFNHYNWGGFLGYQFAGHHKIFIDGRNLDKERFAAYTEILWATPRGRQLMEQDIFSMVIVPERSMKGEPYAIVPYLSGHPHWVLRYRDTTALVFERVAPAAPLAPAL